MADTCSSVRMNPRLIGLNVALLVLLSVVTLLGVLSSRAGAQPGTGGGIAQTRGRGEYTMVSGKIQGSTTAAIYIVDATSQEVVALTWDRATNRFEPIGHRSLTDDARYLTKPR